MTSSTSPLQLVCALLLLLLFCLEECQAWVSSSSSTSSLFHCQSALLLSQRQDSSATSTLLFATSRQPRRNLPKRRRRRQNDEEKASNSNNKDNNAEDTFWQVSELRPLDKARSREQGQDYWIDEREIQVAQAKLAQQRQRQPGQIPNEKLWTEVLSPYKQNWIGIATVLVIVLAVIISQFPELLNSPSIPIPDL